MESAGDAAALIAQDDAAREPDASADGAPAFGPASEEDDGSRMPSADSTQEPPPPPEPYPAPNYTDLAETGFFDPSGAPSPDLVAFEPTYKLWSDGAAKRRFIRLPPGTTIDTSDMDHWIMPVGTKLWKEFSEDGVRLETRLIERYGVGPEDYWMGSFVWNDDGTGATFQVDGAADIRHTVHDAPAQKVCGSCHRGDTGRVLGFSALQLSGGDRSPTLNELTRRGALSQPPNADIGFPGDSVTAAALGYLHANCGHCHNDRGTSWPDTQMVLRLRTVERDAPSTDLFRSLVGVGLQYWRGGAVTQRIAPGNADMSAIVARMHARGSKDQMPPLATELVDDGGLATVGAWINGLPH